MFKGVFWGPQWDSEPYCVNSSNASKGIHALPYITVATQALLAPTGDAPIEQSKVSSMLRKGNCYSNDNFTEVFERRLIALFPELCDAPLLPSELPKVC